jgi:FkbM family methyltransferase
MIRPCFVYYYSMLSKIRYLFSIYKEKQGLNTLSKALIKHVEYKNGYFVELGANDGISQSNTLYLEKYLGWRGVLIEPDVNNYIKCLKNRSQNNIIFCCACVSFSYKDEFVKIVYSNLMTVALELETDLQDAYSHAAIGEAFLKDDQKIFTFNASAKTLNALLDEANSPELIDLAVIDVEGAEIEVLKGINHNKYIFKYICVESRDINKISIYLNAYGYILIEKLTHHDYLFKKI